MKLASRACSECDESSQVAYLRQSASHVLVMPNDTVARWVLQHSWDVARTLGTSAFCVIQAKAFIVRSESIAGARTGF